MVVSPAQCGVILQVVAGFGCQRGCPARELSALLDQVLDCSGLVRGQVVGITSLDRKADEPGLLALARDLGVPFKTFSAPQLAALEGQLSHRSEISYAHTGCYGVAESSALALAATTQLLVTRQTSQSATVALAITNTL